MIRRIWSPYKRDAIGYHTIVTDLLVVRICLACIASVLPALLSLDSAWAAGPALTWTQMGSSYRSPDPDRNWCFVPAVFNGELFVPMGDVGACVVKKWTGSDWVDDFLDDDWGTGRDFENLTFLMVYNNKLYMTCETDGHGIMARDAAGNWSVSYPYTYTSDDDPLMQYGSFGLSVCNGKLYTGVSPYPAGTLTIYKHNGSSWTAIKDYNTGEQLRAWSLGSDGTNVYVGIGRRARVNATTLGIERFNGSTWTSELAGKAIHSMAYFKGSMYAGGNGPIYKRSGAGTWSQVFNTAQTFVVAMCIIDYGGGMEVLYAGAENRPRLYATTDGVNWDMMHEFDTNAGACSVASYQNTPVAGVTYYEGSTRKIVKVWRGTPQNMSPQVNAGPDQIITLPDSANLNGTVTDDGLPDPPGQVTVTWTKQSGPGTVTFSNPSAVDTTASFSQAGVYVLRLEASDSQLTGQDELSITVNPRRFPDFDNDDDVDQEDFGYLQVCFSGSGVFYNPGCEEADLNGDNDVDSDDLALFLGCMAGANKPPGC